MSIKFSADEVFKVAERIEENGAAFYRRAAELHPSEHNKTFLRKLASMEDDHLKTFAAMRAKLSDAEREQTSYDPMNESLMYLKTLADLHGGEGSQDAAARLTGKETMEQIILKGIELEKKSILFYMGIEDLISPQMGRDKIDKIISEEKSHVVILSRELNEARKAK